MSKHVHFGSGVKKNGDFKSAEGNGKTIQASCMEYGNIYCNNH
jgi:hypothetical protein